MLHIVSTGQRRGAELFASDLVASLGLDGITQTVAVLRAKGRQDVVFDAPVYLLRDSGPTLPGLNVMPRTVRSLRSLIRRWNPDVVQAHGGEALKYAVVANFLHDTPIVYRKIGGAPSWIKHGVQLAAHRFVVRRASRVVAVAETLRRETGALFGVDPTKVVVIANGVAMGRMKTARGRAATRATLGVSSDAPVILSVGALTWEKDPMAHVDIGSRILNARRDAVHLIAGDGPMRSEIEDIVQRRGLRDRVSLLGVRSDIPDLLAASDVLLFASRSDGMEGMPGILIEAGMVGVPTVAYAIAGVSEVVLDRVTGYLVAEGDRGTLAERALQLLADEAERSAMGEKARRRTTDLFDISVIAPKYRHLYEELA